MRKKIILGLIIVIVLLGAFLVAKLFLPCQNCQKLGDDIAPKTSLPNPASVHCEEVGGKLEMKKDAGGGEVGFCTLPDKSVCEEWSLLRNECTENSNYFLHLNIKPGDKITSPLKITGESGGGWFFEGSFPVDLVDWDGRIIATGIAEAKGDWMTTSFVPFEAELTFAKPANLTNQDYAKRGAIIFRKDNPSDKRELDKAYELPITF